MNQDAFSAHPSHPSGPSRDEFSDLRAAPPLSLNGQDLTVEQVVEVARCRRRVRLDDGARARVDRCRALVERLLRGGHKVYGLTTGFGKLRDVVIPAEQVKELQRKLIQSHATGVGEPFPEDVVRAAILLRANTLCKGHSGIRALLLERLIGLLNADVYPYIPEQGSVGASGDLAPLSHLALLLINDPGGRVSRRPLPAGDPAGDPAAPLLPVERDARRRDFCRLPDHPDAARLAALTLHGEADPEARELQAKEGLALNNGTQVMAAISCLALHDMRLLLQTAELAGAMSLEASRGVRAAYEDEIHEARPLPHQLACARRIRSWWEGSGIIDTALNSGHLRRARRSLKDAEVSLRRLRAQVDAAGEEESWTLRRLPGRLADLRLSIDGLLPRLPGADPLPAWDDRDLEPVEDRPVDPAALAAWHALAEREQIASAEAWIAPVRRSASVLLRDVQSVSFPEQEAARQIRSALARVVEALSSAVPDAPLFQDDYSLRCYPQVLACAWRAWDHVHEMISIEINAATDNPLLFPQPKDAPPCEALTDQQLAATVDRYVKGGGNFHGEPLAIGMDYLAIAAAEVGSISERRVAHLVDESLSRGLPGFLIESTGLNSGFMLAQYTAAALVSENKVLCHPASVDSIPTCANTEDHVSMGSIATRKCAKVIQNLRRVVGIELLAGYQALQYRLPLQPGRPIRAVVETMRGEGIERIQDDVVMYVVMDQADALLDKGSFRRHLR